MIYMYVNIINYFFYISIQCIPIFYQAFLQIFSYSVL